MRQKPWDRYPHIWKTESAYWTWLRGHFRMIWSRYPVKIEFKKNNSYLPPEGYTGRAKNLGSCALCGERDIPISKLEVDHIDTVGSFSDEDTAMEWLWRLLCDEENMQLVHKECHKVKSFADRTGQSFEDALIEKEVIKICKEKKDIAWLKDHNIEPASNASKRRIQILEAMKLPPQ